MRMMAENEDHKGRFDTSESGNCPADYQVLSERTGMTRGDGQADCPWNSLIPECWGSGPALRNYCKCSGGK